MLSWACLHQLWKETNIYICNFFLENTAEFMVKVQPKYNITRKVYGKNIKYKEGNLHDFKVQSIGDFFSFTFKKDIDSYCLLLTYIFCKRID